MKLEVAFCRLDARDDSYTGYSPAGFVANDREFQDLSQEQELLHIRLNREYLTRVAALQDELEEKYTKLLKALKIATPAVPEPWGKALDKDTYEAAEKAAEKEFPGWEATYYT